MIKFNYIIIYNYGSIKEIKLPFTNGVHSINGHNGVGKTTILMAILQGLFNKNIKTFGDNIDNTYNRFTGKPYRIIINFSKYQQEKEIVYNIDNNRGTNQISITEDNIDITPKGIKQQLQMIENILGIGYEVFSSFYYLSSKTIDSIFDLTNQDNLIFKFFDVATLNNLSKSLRSKDKELKAQKNGLSTIVKRNKEQLNKLATIVKVDVEQLKNQKLIMMEALNVHMEQEVKKDPKLPILKGKHQQLKQEVLEDKTKLNVFVEQNKKLTSGVCPTCHQIVDTNQIVDTDALELSLKKKQQTLTTLSNKIKELEEEYSNRLQSFNEIKIEYNNKINNINTQILVAKEGNKQLEYVEEVKQKLQEDAEKAEEALEVINTRIVAVHTLSSIIKSKAITKEYLNTFIGLINNRLTNLREKVDYPLDIQAYENKGMVKFRFENDDFSLNLKDLSSGEKTRVSLITLFAIIDTIKLISGVNFNVLAIDEILGVLDAKGVVLFKKLLDLYRKDTTIFVIQHHDEIKDAFFDINYKLKKINNITYMEKN